MADAGEVSQGSRFGVFEDEFQNLKGILGRGPACPKGYRYKGRVHLGELDDGGFEALARVLVPGRVDLKGNPNLITQYNSPSLASSLSSIKSSGLGGFQG